MSIVEFAALISFWSIKLEENLDTVEYRRREIVPWTGNRSHLAAPEQN
jgi:hypothetical protein